MDKFLGQCRVCDGNVYGEFIGFTQVGSYCEDCVKVEAEAEAEKVVKKIEELGAYEIENVERDDYPDFCDAFLASASVMYGTKISDLSENELEKINESQAGREFINRMACLIFSGG